MQASSIDDGSAVKERLKGIPGTEKIVSQTPPLEAEA